MPDSQLLPPYRIEIYEVSEKALRKIREHGCFPDDLLAALDRFQESLRNKSPWQPLKKIEESLEGELPQEQIALLPSALAHTRREEALVVSQIPDSDDFTFFVDRGGPEAEAGKAVAQLTGIPEDSTSWEGTLWLWQGENAVHGRVLLCSCAHGAKWSLTLRRQISYPARHVQETFFNDRQDIADLLSETIFSKRFDSDEHGLVVVAGRTGSSKSWIAQQLIYHCLKAGGQRTPHLVTFEDPIEKYLGKKGVEADYTQRERPIDARNLNEVVENALRQTPKVVFVGETRDPRDWKKLLEFAGTGHLVVTTAHAGSLVEAVGNILQETESSTPATRSIVADRVLAVVHLKTATDSRSRVSFLVPAMWHRTPLGIKALMAEGLSSLLPNTPPRYSSNTLAPLPGSVGRYWFARELAERSQLSDSDMKKRVKRTALEWDLEGL